uniref:IRG-type G domain-containing protein n=1 Tax=Alexandrium catenella TaxID=2925 RepID=A0A7S1R1W1_ALECA
MGDNAAEIVALKGRSSWDVRLGDGRVVTVDRSMLKGVSSACVFWDLPGVGTPNYPQATYVREMGIRYFDVVVLLTSTRFTEAELMLVKELRSWQVPFFLVRNKTDVDVQAEIEAEEDEEGTDLSKERREEVESETLQTIRDYFKAEFGLDRVYCISSRIRLADRFDFRMLERDLEEGMSQEDLCK